MKDQIIYKELEKIVRYEDKEHSVEFECFEIVGKGEGNTKGIYDKPFFEKKGAKSSDDTTENIDEAQTYIRGAIKWDGCSHIYFGDEEGYIHMHGKRDMSGIGEILTKIYEHCAEIMGDKFMD